MPSARLSLLLALLSLAAACAKRVTVAGREMTESAADAFAEAELERVRQETAAQPPERAAQAFESLAARLGAVPAAADALYQAALKWRAARRFDRAVAALGQLLTRFPLSPLAVPAKYQLALVDLETGRSKEALQTLVTLYDKLPAPQRLEAAQRLAEAAEAARAWPLAVRWRAEVIGLAPDADRDKELPKLAELIDGRLSFLEVAKLREELPPDSPAMPALVMKAARVYVHLHQYDLAEVAAREELERWPLGPYADDARTLLERLLKRARVNPGVLGLAIPTSGRFQSWGEAIMQGVTLALEGSTLRVAVRDSRGEADGVAQAVEALALEEGAIAVLGGVANAEAQRAAAAAQELELPFLSLSKVEGVTEAGPYVFRNMLTAQAQAQALVEFAFARRGMRRFAVFYPDIPYGQELASAFWDEVEAHGGEVRGAESYEHDRTTFSALVKDMIGKLYLDERADYVEKQKAIMKERDPYRRAKALERMRKQLDPVIDFDAVFIPDFASNVALIAPALAVEDVVTSTCEPKEVERIRRSTGREDLRPVQLLGANGWDDPTLVEKAGRYVQCAVFVDGFFAGSERPETRSFVEAFEKKYGHPPSILEASAHDSVRMLRRVLERAQTRAAVRDGLAALKGFKGATGELSFDDRREAAKTLFFLTVDKTGVREMTPAELAAAGAGGS